MRQDISARHVYDMVIVGNTAMHHLALGLSPEGLSGAPFAPALDEPISLAAAELGLAMNPGGRVYSCRRLGRGLWGPIAWP